MFLVNPRFKSYLRERGKFLEIKVRAPKEAEWFYFYLLSDCNTNCAPNNSSKF